MKAHYRTQDGRLMFDLEGTTKDIFAGIAGIQEVFEADTTCGCCGKARIRFRVRSSEEYQFFEYICLDCHAVLAFGTVKATGALYAKRKEGDRYLPDRGWKVWQPGAAAAEPAAASAAKW